MTAKVKWDNFFEDPNRMAVTLALGMSAATRSRIDGRYKVATSETTADTIREISLKKAIKLTNRWLDTVQRKAQAAGVEPIVATKRRAELSEQTREFLRKGTGLPDVQEIIKFEVVRIGNRTVRKKYLSDEQDYSTKSSKRIAAMFLAANRHFGTEELSDDLGD